VWNTRTERKGHLIYTAIKAVDVNFEILDTPERIAWAAILFV
jgi:hypothetical protein